MSVLVIADLHLDRWLQAGRDPLAALPRDLFDELDGLIVAGDLTNNPGVRWPRMIRLLASYLPPGRIHLLPGNHDYYDCMLDGEDRLTTICAEEGAHFLQKSELVLSGIRFLCATLWTDFALKGDPARAMRIAERGMNDYACIRLGAGDARQIRPEDTALIHADHRTWLEARLAQPFAGRTIVVTHHCPHPDLVGAWRSELDPAYAANLLPLIERAQPDAWLFGHTHHPIEGIVGRTLVRNVSLGYPYQVSRGAEAGLLMRGLIRRTDHAGQQAMQVRAARADPAAARAILKPSVPDLPPDDGETR
ncbi:metallophosphoesterase [Gemmobacter aquaticus]|uniref:Metallophosphoesterase n=1 Tax=Gemmobacter aquaticus TaxID=490185 RepID=A0A918DF78_9RHOB|nr:metallophosphoesterase [Gemmobacter aquaticus]GGO39277.1 metallophosphoesterase [Gemmobacter aquaticus]